MARRARWPEYLVWIDLRRRCHQPKYQGFPTYGGRGIAVCDQWRKSFTAFLNDMGRRPSSKHSIDRIDNDGNYEPGNCRWATRVEQSRNRRNVRLITYQGETLPLSVWAQKAGIDRHALRDRLVNLGWDLERALTTPTINGHPIGFRGEMFTLNVWARKLGIPQGTLWYRIYRFGWDIERALSTPSGSQARCPVR